MSKKTKTVPCLCVDCTCTGCKEECFGHCSGCGDPVTECNSYQTEGSKYLWGVPESELAAAEQALDDLELTEPEPPATPDAAPPAAAPVDPMPADMLILTNELKKFWGMKSLAELVARPLVPCSRCAYWPWCSGVTLDDEIFEHLDELGVSAAQLDCVLDLLTGCTMGKRKENA